MIWPKFGTHVQIKGLHHSENLGCDRQSGGKLMVVCLYGSLTAWGLKPC